MHLLRTLCEEGEYYTKFIDEYPSLPVLKCRRYWKMMKQLFTQVVSIQHRSCTIFFFKFNIGRFFQMPTYHVLLFCSATTIVTILKGQYQAGFYDGDQVLLYQSNVLQRFAAVFFFAEYIV